MKFDALMLPDKLGDTPAYARAIEAVGFAGAWTPETAHNPFFPLVLAAEHTQRIELGTAIAVAFPRSPTVLAHIAWDLAAQSNGRFILGLGTQVRAHIERRFGAEFEHPIERLRDQILAMRAVWHTWQTGARLNYRSDFYKLTLMTPFFSPPPLADPHIPIYIAGVNKRLCHLAGEICDGFLVHPFNSRAYLSEVILPNIEAGAASLGRSRKDIALVGSIFVIGEDDPGEAAAMREAARQQIAFYASTPTYRGVLEMHSWGAVGEELSSLAARQKWTEMPALITEAMLDEYAVAGRWADIPGLIQRRFGGLLDRVMYYLPFVPGQMDERWQQATTQFHSFEN